MKKILLALTVLIVVMGFEREAESLVFMKREEALTSAFPDADNIIKTKIFLTEEQVREVESLSKTSLDSRFYVIYEGKRGDEVLGYAIIDTHMLRSQSETVMFVINTDGTLRYAEVLAFFEPPDYIAGEKWMNLFRNKGLDTHPLRLGNDIPNMSGATITAVAITNSVRKFLAIYNVSAEQGLLSSKAGN